MERKYSQKGPGEVHQLRPNCKIFEKPRGFWETKLRLTWKSLSPVEKQNAEFAVCFKFFINISVPFFFCFACIFFLESLGVFAYKPLRMKKIKKKTVEMREWNTRAIDEINQAPLQVKLFF